MNKPEQVAHKYKKSEEKRKQVAHKSEKLEEKRTVIKEQSPFTFGLS